MAPQAPPPELRGLRLGFADWAAATLALESILELSGTPSSAARRVYALGGLRLEAWAEPPGTAHASAALHRPLRCDTLLWHGPDIAAQRRHLRQLGLCAPDGDDLGCPDCLRVEAIQTSACAVEWHAAQAAPRPDAALGLVAIELCVRAPERTAAHWAALLDAALARDTLGAPLLQAAPAALRFVPAAESAGTGISALMFAAPQAHRLAQRAAAQGIAVAADASWTAAGLRIRSAPPG